MDSEERTTRASTPESNDVSVSEQPEYWVCIIGPVKRSEMPIEFDTPLRKAAVDAVNNGIGRKVKNCWSGWGCSEKWLSRECGNEN